VIVPTERPPRRWPPVAAGTSIEAAAKAKGLAASKIADLA
jgi:hypothetical protein